MAIAWFVTINYVPGLKICWLEQYLTWLWIMHIRKHIFMCYFQTKLASEIGFQCYTSGLVLTSDDFGCFRIYFPSNHIGLFILYLTCAICMLQSFKRDDLSGMQLSGNKVRKLEFLLADAVAQGADCIVSIGGIQSNHCRATAVAAKYLNLDCYLILRTSKVCVQAAESILCWEALFLSTMDLSNLDWHYHLLILQLLVDNDPGLTGNLLVERLVGAHIDLVSKEEYAKVGSVVCILYPLLYLSNNYMTTWSNSIALLLRLIVHCTLLIFEILHNFSIN